ncbi:hypothetical protein ES703_88796 [subsurface metagenome]
MVYRISYITGYDATIDIDFPWPSTAAAVAADSTTGKRSVSAYNAVANCYWFAPALQQPAMDSAAKPEVVARSHIFGYNAVSNPRAAPITVYSPAHTSLIPAEGTATQRRVALRVVHTAASTRQVTDESTIGQRRITVVVVAHPTTPALCAVTIESAVDQRRAATVVEYPPTTTVTPEPSC